MFLLQKKASLLIKPWEIILLCNFRLFAYLYVLLWLGNSVNADKIFNFLLWMNKNASYVSIWIYVFIYNTLDDGAVMFCLYISMKLVYIYKYNWNHKK